MVRKKIVSCDRACCICFMTPKPCRRKKRVTTRLHTYIAAAYNIVLYCAVCWLNIERFSRHLRYRSNYLLYVDVHTRYEVRTFADCLVLWRVIVCHFIYRADTLKTFIDVVLKKPTLGSCRCTCVGRTWVNYFLCTVKTTCHTDIMGYNSRYLNMIVKPENSVYAVLQVSIVWVGHCMCIM